MPKISNTNNNVQRIHAHRKYAKKVQENKVNTELDCSHQQWLQPRPVLKDIVYCQCCHIYKTVIAIISDEQFRPSKEK